MNSDFDIEKLKYEMNALKIEGIDLEVTGFDLSEIDDILNDSIDEDTLELEEDDEEEDDKTIQGFVCPHCGHKASKKEFLECDING